MGRLGVVAGLAGVARHRIAVDSHEPLGLADAAALGDVLEHGRDLLLGQMGAEQRGRLAFGEARATGAASEESDRVVLPVVAANREVFPAPDAMIGALGIQAAESGEVVHGPPLATYHAVRAKSCDSAPE